MYKIMNFNPIIICAFLFTFTFVIDGDSAECVPVFVWGTALQSDAVSTLKIIDEESFKAILVDQLPKHTPIAIFAEQNLSPEDFNLRESTEGNVFSELSVLKGSNQVGYWPCVKNPINAIEQLPDKVKVQISIAEILADPVFKLNVNDVLNIDLNDAVEGEYRNNMLERHDIAINTVYEKLKRDNNAVIAIFTGHHPSWVLSEELRNLREKRDTVVANREDNQTVVQKVHTQFSNDDVLIYGTPIIYFNDSVISLESFKIKTENKTEDGMHIIFNSETTKDVTVDFDFAFGGGYWILKNITVHNASATNINDTEYYFKVNEVYAAMSFSYYCNDQNFFRINNRNQNLSFEGMQLQAYENSTGPHKFGDALDCVGFMSIPIWSGLFITFILALIMTFGLTMMMNIKTMDRFDDPKGKTITINTSE